jgi:hypothetical protein
VPWAKVKPRTFRAFFTVQREAAMMASSDLIALDRVGLSVEGPHILDEGLRELHGQIEGLSDHRSRRR